MLPDPATAVLSFNGGTTRTVSHKQNSQDKSVTSGQNGSNAIATCNRDIELENSSAAVGVQWEQWHNHRNSSIPVSS